MIPATPDGPQEGLPTRATPAAGPYDATSAQPRSSVPPADPYQGRTVMQPLPVEAVPARRVAAAYVEEPLKPLPKGDPPSKAPWAVLAAVIALVVGGVIGYVIGNHNKTPTSTLGTAGSLPTGDSVPLDQATVDKRANDIFTLLAAQARQPGGIQTPTPYPALDDLLSVLGVGGTATTATTTASSGPADVATLTAQRDQLSAQVTTLQGQVTDLQNQLATSQATVASLQQTVSSNPNTGDLQSKIDDQAQQITDLQGKLDAANAKLDAANTSLQTAQGQLATANASLQALDVQQLDNYVGMDITKVRSTAKANGWVLVEQPADAASGSGSGSTSTTTTVAGQTFTVSAQMPAVGANMVKGSVLYVEVGSGS
ncbi:MAG: hypothetical protein JWM34_708 [Ilumatobacteraceae bacterium]|nr:hypothetical protein [Ilumatobacteraceae bacterium]